MKFGVNHHHVALWKRYAVTWFVFVGSMVIVGWGYGPRIDEVIVVMCLPIPILIAYVLFCFLSVVVRSLWPVGTQPGWWRQRFLCGFAGDDSLGDQGRPERNRRASNRIPHR